MSEEGRDWTVPNAPECEAGMLSILAQWPKETMELLREEAWSEGWLYMGGHQKMFALIAGELEAGRRVDFRTLATRARDLALEEQIGVYEHGQWVSGAAALSKLWGLVPSANLLGGYLDELREKFLARELQSACKATLKAIEENWQTAGLPLVREMQAEISELSSYGVRLETVRHIKPAVWTAIEKIQTQFNARAGTLGLSTGIKAVDRCLNGIIKGQGYYIGGRPAMGKSAFLGDLCDFIGTNPDPWAAAHVLVFSVEMTELQSVTRSVMKEARIPQQRVRDGLLSEDRDFPKLAQAAEKLAKSRIHIDDTSTLSIEELSARVRRFVRKIRSTETPEQKMRREKSDRPDVVVGIDYLQRLKGNSKRARENRYLEIAEICQGLSVLWKELQIAGLVLVQLGRNDKEGADTFPSMSDMRESGDIEAEAHVIMAIHRPVKYLIGPGKKEKWVTKENERLTAEGGNSFEWRVGVQTVAGMAGRDLEHLAYVCVLKQREGPCDELMTHFEPTLARFSNWNEEEKLYSPHAAHHQATQGNVAPADQDGDVGGELE